MDMAKIDKCYKSGLFPERVACLVSIYHHTTYVIIPILEKRKQRLRG